MNHEEEKLPIGDLKAQEHQSSTVQIAKQGITAAYKNYFADFSSFVPIVLCGAFFYILVIRPQEKKNKAHAELISSLKLDEHIITTSGIYGKVTKIYDNKMVEIELEQGLMKISRNAVAEIINRKTEIKKT